MSKFRLDLHNHHQVAFIAIWSLVIAAAISFALYSTFAGVGTGVSYDWKKGQVLSSYKMVNKVSAGWDLVKFSYVDDANKTQEFTMWVPTSNPMIASRDLQIDDTGDDVTALQNSLNLLRPTDQSNANYYDKINVSGVYDQSTVNAVYILQGYFGYEQTGMADINFQTSLYQLIVTPPTN